MVWYELSNLPPHWGKFSCLAWAGGFKKVNLFPPEGKVGHFVVSLPACGFSVLLFKCRVFVQVAFLSVSSVTVSREYILPASYC
jgi:hypothetical protein